jgi:hypothetical protein
MPTNFIADCQRQFVLDTGTINLLTLIDLLPVNVKQHAPLTSLEKAIAELNFDFYNELLPKIAQWASDHERQGKLVEPLHSGETARVTYRASEIRYILANAFFLNTVAGYGNIDLLSIYNAMHNNVAAERIRCLIEYFRVSSFDENDQRTIDIERYCYGDELPQWSEQNIPIQASTINIVADRMEDVDGADGFVDFANKRIHIHRIIGSATQEEVLCKSCDSRCRRPIERVRHVQ